MPWITNTLLSVIRDLPDELTVMLYQVRNNKLYTRYPAWCIGMTIDYFVFRLLLQIYFAVINTSLLLWKAKYWTIKFLWKKGRKQILNSVGISVQFKFKKITIMVFVILSSLRAWDNKCSYTLHWERWSNAYPKV